MELLGKRWKILRTEEQDGSCAPLELLSQEQTSLGRGRLVVRKAREEERVQWGEEAGERGRSQVTKARQNP